jgi:uncharacterized protein (DUF58 family)
MSQPPTPTSQVDALRKGHWTGLRLTPQGRMVLAVVGVFLLVGILKNINLLVLLGHVLLGLLALGAFVVGRRMRRIEARRILSDHVFAGMSSRLEVRMHNVSTRSIRGVRLEDVGEDHSIGWYFDEIAGHERRAMVAEVVLPRRGWYDFAPLAVASSHPFGLWQRRVMIGLPLRALILPRPGKILRERLRHYLKSADPRGERVHRHGWRHEAAQADFHGLRPFRAGDSPRWIHWRTSARRGELMVREFEDVPGDDIVLILDTCCNEERLEAGISLATTIVSEWNQRRGDRFLLVLPGAEPDVYDGVTSPEHAHAMLRALALAQTSTVECNVAFDVPSTAAVLVIAFESSKLPQRLEVELGCPVTLLTPELLDHQGIYTPP